MDDLLFRISPILLDPSWKKEDLLVIFGIIGGALFLGILYHYLSHRWKNRPLPLPEKVRFIPLPTNDTQFERQTLALLKTVIMPLYTPQHTVSHTVTEIGNYLFESDLIAIAHELEEAIYQGVPLNQERREKINEALPRCLSKIDNFFAS